MSDNEMTSSDSYTQSTSEQQQRERCPAPILAELPATVNELSTQFSSVSPVQLQYVEPCFPTRLHPLIIHNHIPIQVETIVKTERLSNLRTNHTTHQSLKFSTIRKILTDYLHRQDVIGFELSQEYVQLVLQVTHFQSCCFTFYKIFRPTSVYFPKIVFYTKTLGPCIQRC